MPVFLHLGPPEMVLTPPQCKFLLLSVLLPSQAKAEGDIAVPPPSPGSAGGPAPTPTH